MIHHACFKGSDWVLVKVGAEVLSSQANDSNEVRSCDQGKRQQYEDMICKEIGF